jgi:hypothetical protein
MAIAAETELVTLAGREIKIHWKSPRFKEWLAWCYVAAGSNSPMEGVGFEARADSPEGAKTALLEQVRTHLGTG